MKGDKAVYLITISATRRILFHFLFLTLVLFCEIPLTCYAQTPPNPAPPPIVVTEARRVAGIMGLALPTSDPSYQAEIAQNTGNTLWELTWSGIEITVDAGTVKALKFDDNPSFMIASKNARQNISIALSMSDAQAKFNQLCQDLALPPGDWRTQKAELIHINGSTGLPLYNFVLRLYAYNKPVALGYFMATIEPYTGKITDWDMETSATFSVPSATLLTKAQAQQYAEAAFLQYAGPSLVSTDATTPAAGGSGTWEPLSDSTTLSRINYRFIFPLSEIPSATTGDEPQRYEQEIWVDIDGETGEVAFIGNVIASGPLKKVGKIPTSSRMALLNAMAIAKAPDTLLAAITSGQVLPAASAKIVAAKAGKGKHSQFSQKTAKGEQSFTFDPSKRFLLWKGTGKDTLWQGLLVPKKQAEQLAVWIKDREASLHK